MKMDSYITFHTKETFVKTKKYLEQNGVRYKVVSISDMPSYHLYGGEVYAVSLSLKGTRLSREDLNCWLSENTKY